MESKKINQLATNVNPQQSDLTTIGDPITGQLKKITWLQVAHLIGAQAAVTLQQVTSNGNTTTDPITTGGLTLTNLNTGVPRLTSGQFVGTYGYGLANGVATLDSGGKIPAAQLPSSVMEYKGTWNASTNTPTLADGTGDNGDVYLVNVAGSQNLGSGTISFAVGDWVVYNGTIWQKSLNSNAVASVFGRTGTITAQEGDYTIDQLGDVAITTPATNDYLRYNGTGWVNTQFPTFVSSDKLVLQVRNNSGATINKGTVVYINGATAGYPTIAKAQANQDSTSAQTLGLVQDNISNNSNGIVVLVGQITGIDTSAYPAGTQLYLSGTTAGAYTSTKVLAPTHLVYVGIVTTQNAINGVIEVKIQNGYELDEIHDVAISSVANNQVLVYESASTLWKNKSLSTILGGSPVTGSGTANQLAFWDSSSNITGSSFLTLDLTANYGYLKLTGGATYKNADIWLDRYSNAWENAIRFQTNGTTDWYVGSSATGSNNDFEIYNYGTSSNGFKIAKASNNVTFTGTITGVLSALATTATLYVVSDSGTLKTRTTGEMITDLAAVPQTRTLTINGTSYDLSANRTWSVGTVTSVAATAGTGISISGSPITSSGTLTITNTAPDQIVGLTAGTGISITGTYPSFTITNTSPSSGGTVTSIALATGTTGTDVSVSGSPITSSGTITLNIPTASATNRGALSSADWTTFNNKLSAAITSLNGLTASTQTFSNDTNVTITSATSTHTLGWSGQLSIARGGTGLSALGTAGQLLRVNAGATALEYFTPTYISAAITSLNGLTAATQTFATGTSGTDFAISSATSTHTFNLPTASATNRGALSSSDWSTFNSKQAAITLTTTGSSGAATFVSNTLNIPNYTLSGLGGVPTSRTLTINGTTYDLSADRTWTISTGTVTGSGTTNYIPKWTSSSALGDSAITDNGTTVTLVSRALSGTSATFSATYSAGGTVNIMQWQRSGGAVAADMTYNDANTSMNFGTSTAHALNLKTGGTTALSISSTGAATFTGSLSGTSATFSGSVGVTGFTTKTGNGLFFNFGSSAANQSSIQSYDWGASTFRSLLIDVLDFNVATNGTNRLTIASTGAATFSGLVTLATGATQNKLNWLGYNSAYTLISSDVGYDATYNGLYITHNTNSAGSAQGNAAIPSWYVNLGGSNQFNISRSNAGSFTFTPLFTLSGTGAATFSSSVEVGAGTYSSGLAKLYTSATYGTVLTGKSGTSSDMLLTDRSGNIALQVVANGSTPNVIMNGGGNVGIGTTSPLSILHILGQSGTTGLPSLLLYGESPSTGQRYGFNVSADQLDVSALGTNARIAFFTGGNASTAASQERMRITSGGNVGIGTTSPTSNYGFEKNLTIASANNAELSLSQTGNSNFFSIGITNGFNFFQTTTGQGYVFYIAGTERMRISSTGDLTVKGGTHTLYTNSGATISFDINVTRGRFYQALTVDGNVTAAAFFESSDIRLKSNIKDYKSNDILNISAKIYEKDGKIEVGYLAQDLENVLNSAISVRDNGYLDLSYRQVHTAKIAALEAKILELEAKLK